MTPGGAARWSALTAAVAAILGGIAEAGDRELAAALFAVGFLLLGVWIVLMIREP